MTETQTTTEAAEGTLRWYVESDKVADTYKPNFEAVIEAFNNDEVAKITSRSVLHDSGDTAYVYETGDRTYLYGTVTEGSFHITEFCSIKHHPTIQVLVMMGESFTSVDLTESPLYDLDSDSPKDSDGMLKKQE